MNKGFTLVESLIVISILAFLLSIAIPSYFIGKKGIEGIRKAQAEAQLAEAQLLPMERNDIALKDRRVEKLFELDGHDVYTFTDEFGKRQSVAIPTDQSVYDLERE